MTINGREVMTISDIALKLGLTSNTTKQRIYRANLQPVVSGAFYDVNDIEKICAANPKGFQPGNQCATKKKDNH